MEKKHEIAWWAWTTNLRPEYWQTYHSENAHKPQTNNITNTDNKEIDALIDQFRKSVEEADRIKLAHQIQQKIHDEACFIPAFMIPYFRSAYWRYLKTPKVPATKLSGDAFEVFGEAMGGLFWIDEAARKETFAALKSGGQFPVTTVVDKTFKVK